MTIYSFSKADRSAPATTYYTTTITPTITENTDIIATYQPVVPSGTAIVPAGSRGILGGRALVGESLARARVN